MKSLSDACSDAQTFLQVLNQGQGDQSFRLPTEAQWEYGCRAGTSSAWYGDLDAIAWYSKNSGSQTHPVRKKDANVWGLYDMLGNIWEWCADVADLFTEPRLYPNRPETYPVQDIMERRSRVIRGGSWNNLAQYVRAAIRHAIHRENRYDYLGFRLARGQK